MENLLRVDMNAISETEENFVFAMEDSVEKGSAFRTANKRRNLNKCENQDLVSSLQMTKNLVKHTIKSLNNEFDSKFSHLGPSIDSWKKLHLRSVKKVDNLEEIFDQSRTISGEKVLSVAGMESTSQELPIHQQKRTGKIKTTAQISSNFNATKHSSKLNQSTVKQGTFISSNKLNSRESPRILKSSSGSQTQKRFFNTNKLINKDNQVPEQSRRRVESKDTSHAKYLQSSRNSSLLSNKKRTTIRGKVATGLKGFMTLQQLLERSDAIPEQKLHPIQESPDIKLWLEKLLQKNSDSEESFPEVLSPPSVKSSQESCSDTDESTISQSSKDSISDLNSNTPIKKDDQQHFCGSAIASDLIFEAHIQTMGGVEDSTKKLSKSESQKFSQLELPVAEKKRKSWTQHCEERCSESVGMKEDGSKNLLQLSRAARLDKKEISKINIKSKCSLKVATEFKSAQDSGPPAMPKKTLKEFCLNWDKASEGKRNHMLDGFRDTYAKIENEGPLDVNGLFHGAGHLLFVRFAIGLKMTLIKREKTWRYLRCLKVFICSMDCETYTDQVLTMNLLDEVLQIIELDEEKLCDKIEALHFLLTLIIGINGPSIKRLVCKKCEYLQAITHHLKICTSPDFINDCRLLLENLCMENDEENIILVFRSMIDVLTGSLSILVWALVFRVLQTVVRQVPSTALSCVDHIFEKLRYHNPHEQLIEISELTLVILDTKFGGSMVEKLSQIEIGPTLGHRTFEKPIKCRSFDSTAGLARNNENAGKSRLQRLQEKTSRDNYKQQVGALYIICHALTNRIDLLQLFMKNGVFGLSLLALGSHSHREVQSEGIKLVRILNEINFECTASYLLAVPDAIMNVLQTEGENSLDLFSSAMCKCFRELGRFTYNHWNKWVESVIYPAKPDLFKDFEANFNPENFSVIEHISSRHESIGYNIQNINPAERAYQIQQHLIFLWANTTRDDERIPKLSDSDKYSSTSSSSSEDESNESKVRGNAHAEGKFLVFKPNSGTVYDDDVQEETKLS